MTIRNRIFFTMLVLAVGMMIVGGVGLYAMNHIVHDLDDMYRQRVVGTKELGDLESADLDRQGLLALSAMTENAAEREKFRALRYKRRDEATELFKSFEAKQQSEAGKQSARDIAAARANLQAGIEQVDSALTAGDAKAASRIIIDRVDPAFDALAEAMDKASALQFEAAKEALANAEGEFKTSRAISIAAIVAGVALAAALAMLLIRAIASGLNSAVSIASKIADGQLGNRIDANRSDELGALLQALKRMDEKLHDIVGSVRGASDSVGGAASQLSQGNDDLSQRTQEQASALEETAASMEEMTATVKQNADNARQANQLATGARSQAERGGQVVSRAVGAMEEINSSSRKIADIISVIDEIAFQTNLLALNAAVEAARAGEQGRGFAVVASEVRSLAQRSASAAKEIKDLIGDSVEKVRTGSELVDESGKVLSEIMESVKRVSDIVAEIAAASEEQASGIDQVNNAITQMDDTTQQNAALVEEAASAAKAMEQQAQHLISSVAFFRTQDARVVGAPVASVTPLRPATASARKVAKPRLVVAKPSAPLQKASGSDAAWQEF